MGARPDIDVFRYEDYRLYLRDWFAHAKKCRGGFSFRSLAAKAGFSSSGFFQRIIDGTRNLSTDSIAKVAASLGLNKQESEFFNQLVQFNQETESEKKSAWYRLMTKHRRFSELRPLSKEQCLYFSEWYHPVVRELACSSEFDGSPAWIAERIRDKLTSQQVTRSLEIMTALGLLQALPGGRYRQTESMVTSGDEAASALLVTYHKQVQRWIYGGFERTPQKRRDLSVVTLGIKAKHLPEIKKRLQEFRNDLVNHFGQDDDAEEVVVLSLGLMPATRAKRSD